jgi:predicted CoA-binding protein
MMSAFHPGTESVRRILTESRVIAVVGFSSKPQRFSHTIARYLADQGYRVWGVNPMLAGQTIADIPVVARIEDVPESVDLVNVFRRSELVPAILDQAIAAKARVFWMQDGVIHPESAIRASAAGLEVVMNDCTLRCHRQLCIATF